MKRGGRIAADLVAAFGLLTRLPLPPAQGAGPMGRAVWAWPLVGLVVGLIAALVLMAAQRLGLPPWPSALLALAAGMVATGGLHEDGLADCADGLGGATPERRLAIMKDSRIGSFGALALILSIGLRASALVAIAPAMQPMALVVTGILARAAMLAPLVLPPARPGGLGALLGRPPHASLVAAIAIAIALDWLLLPGAGHWRLLAAAAIAALAVTLAARRSLGGHTGDVFGATEQLAECAVLLAIAVALPGV